MNPIAFSIFGLEVRWYGIIMASAIMIGTFIAMNSSKKEGLKDDTILDILIWAVPISILCARLYYVLFSWSDYKNNLIDVFAFRQGGMAIHGALIGAFLSGYIIIRIKKLNFLQIADIVAPAIVLGQAIGRWGNFLNQEAHGGPVSEKFISFFPAFIKNQMFIDGQYYHPTFLYESLWCLVVFAILIVYKKYKSSNGELLALYMIMYSAERFIVEGLRTDSLMIGTFRIAQLISLFIALSGIVLFVHLRKKAKRIIS